jgi:hypothetical protein
MPAQSNCSSSSDEAGGREIGARPPGSSSTTMPSPTARPALPGIGSTAHSFPSEQEARAWIASGALAGLLRRVPRSPVMAPNQARRLAKKASMSALTAAGPRGLVPQQGRCMFSETVRADAREGDIGVQLGEIAKANPAVAIGSYHHQHGPNTMWCYAPAMLRSSCRRGDAGASAASAIK